MKIYIPNLTTFKIDIVRLNDDVCLENIETIFNQRYGFNNWFYSVQKANDRLNFYKKERCAIF